MGPERDNLVAADCPVSGFKSQSATPTSIYSIADEWGAYTWRLSGPARAQSAFPWRSNCRSGSRSRGSQRRAAHGRCNFWTPGCSSLSHARAAGIGKASSASKSVAAICGTDTPHAFLAGVSAKGFPTLSLVFCVVTFSQRKMSGMKRLARMAKGVSQPSLLQDPTPKMPIIAPQVSHLVYCLTVSPFCS